MSTRKTEDLSVRNLEQIQEREFEQRSSRASALIMASFGGACIVFAALALMRTPEKKVTTVADPLGDLVAASQDEVLDERDRLGAGDVTFPGVLTDQANPTTAMELVRSAKGGNLDVSELPRFGFDGPPLPGDSLPVVPLPAQDMVDGVKLGKVAPADTLRAMARQAAKEPESGTAEPGRAGGHQLQVSSFKKREDADGFAMALRRRGHRAYVQDAHVKGRGLWHRVRIGPFKYKRSAEIYRQDFEAKERMTGFIVNPPRTRVRIAAAD